MRAVFAVLFSLVCVPAYAWDVKAMNSQVDATNFLVNDNCSATLIDAANGYLLTANHCVADQFRTIERETIGDDGTIEKRKVRVAIPGSVSQIFYAGPNESRRAVYVFKIIKNDSTVDLALVKVVAKLPNTIAAPIACRDPVRGDRAFAVGNTKGVFYATVSNGIIANINRDYRSIGVDDDNAEKGLIQATTPIGGGNSGGALYNDGGEIIGVNVRGYQAISPLALAVPLSDIRAFLADAGPALPDCK